MAQHGTQGRFASVDMAIRWTGQLGEYVTFDKDLNQERKIQEVYKKFADRMKEIKFYGPGKVMTDGEWQEMRVAIETIFAERDKEIKVILSEEQLTKYEEFLKDMQERR
jgi:deoxyribose-phosphate aldolase